MTFTVHVLTPIDDETTIYNQAFSLSSKAGYTETNQVTVTVDSGPAFQIEKSVLRSG